MRQQSETRRTSSISNELSSLANQLNITNDIINDEPTAENQPQSESGDNAKAEEAAETSEAAEAAEAAETSEAASKKDDLADDDINCSVNENAEIQNTSDDSSSSEFVHLKKTTTALQSYLEQFQMENIKSNENSETFDATEELLKMLDKENADS